MSGPTHDGSADESTDNTWDAWDQDDAWEQTDPEHADASDEPPTATWDEAPQETGSEAGAWDTGTWGSDETADTWSEAESVDDTEHEFLVFVEEDDDGTPTDDRIVLDVARQHALGEIQVHPEIEVDLQNRATPTSTSGVASAIFGALMGLFAIGLFIATYPGQWYDGSRLLADEPVIWFTALAGVVGTFFLVLGVMLTHYGQRLQATGSLRSLRITEHATGRSARIHQ